MTVKLSLALPLLLGTALPADFGYDPVAETTAPAMQARLMAIYGGTPPLLMEVGSLLLRGFPIPRERQAAMRADLARRASGQCPSIGRR
jgi:Na+/melibiose symporter-like transporter